MHNELEVIFQSCTMASVSTMYVTSFFSIAEIPLQRGEYSAEQMFGGQDLNLYLSYLLMPFCHKLPCLAEFTEDIVMGVCSAVSIKRTGHS